MKLRFLNLFTFAFGLFVIIPTSLAYCAECKITNDFIETFIYMIYFRIPCILSGGKLFYNDIAVAPNGVGGWIFTVVVYTFMSLILAFAFLCLHKPYSQNKENNVGKKNK